MEKQLSREMSFGISDVALECVMAYIDDPRDRDALSQVCQKWYNIDCLTRKHVTISLCYATSPSRLTSRFPRLESLKLKGKPRAAMFNLIPEDWGGYARPWVNEISVAFNCLKLVHFRRMIVKDEDLEVLVQARGHMLLALKLDRSSGFSTDGLLKVTQSCKCLQTLFLEDCSITERDGRWLHELALNNTTLEMLNFFCMTELKFINIQDLALIAKHCSSLVSLKVSDSCQILDMVDFFRAASHLEEFCGGSFNDQDVDASKYSNFRFPPKLSRLGLMSFMGKNEMPIIFPCAALLKKLDLQRALLDTGDHCQLIQRCPNLEVLEVSTMIGDIGLEVVAHYCKKLKRLRIEIEEYEQEMEDEQGVVSQRGLSALAQGCRELEYLAVYVSDLTNAALESLGTYCKNLCDFRLVLLDKEERITELPLDDGVRSLLLGCGKLRRFALYLRRGVLTDVGLSYIGRYSPNIRYMLLGFVGETDSGLLEFSNGCPRLQKLEMRGCCFSERALSIAVTRLVSLRYIWVQGENISGNGTNLLEMARPYWNIEAIPPKQAVVYDEHGRIIEVGTIEQPAQILAYYSLAGRRTDYPETVIPLYG